MSVELQFHTEKSQAVKDQTHALYEFFRHPDTSPSDKTLTDAKLRIFSAVIDTPDNVDDFHTLAGVDVKHIIYAAQRG